MHVDTERSWGGGQRQLCLLCRGLLRRGHRVWAAVRPGTRVAAELAEAGVVVLPFAPVVEWDPAVVRRLRTLVREVGADLIHAHSGHAVALAALASLGTRTRLVVARRVALPLRWNPVTRWKYARAERIIAVSEHVQEVLRAGGFAASRIGVVRSGVDLVKAPSPARASTLAELGVDGRRPLVVMVSALVPPHKDPVTFVAAVAAARAAGCDCQALLIGAGPLAGSAERARRRAGLDGALRLTGYRSDAPEILAAADVAMLTSRDEGLGTSLLDAMQAGVPVVATAAGGVREVVRDGVDGLLVPVGDAAALGAAIARVLADGKLRGALAAAGRERVKEFSIERTVEATLGEYRKAMSADCGRSGTER
ncbi:MAG TPA: glycosyltransferase family 4 protein [Gemmatimonadales bacterium]|nr:glycosyltransferase family 4 protein [Gemmatimonadales bacterium]